MPDLTIKDVFVECGSSTQAHGKLIKALQKIYTATDLEVFWPEFVRLLKYPMLVYAREPVVERTIDFVAKFVTSVSNATEEDNESDNRLFNKLVTFLLEVHGACNQGARLRSCQLINKLLTNLGEDAHIDDEVYEEVFVGMLERARDKLPAVRVQAVQALARLQDPSDKECPIIKAYLFLMSCDPSADVRRAVVLGIAPSPRTLTAILERTRDVKDSVRKVAYQVISEKVHIKALSIAQRLQLLTDGLRDRSEMVVNVCNHQLLQSWLRASAGNVLELLKHLDVLSSLDTCEKALAIMFKNSPVAELVENFDLLGDKLLIPREQLTGESAMYWCNLCRYIHSLGDSQDELLEMVFPNCAHFCDYIREYLVYCGQCTDVYEQLEHEFVLQQLLTMTSFMNLSDQASRKILQKLYDDMLKDEKISHLLVKHIMPRLLELYSDHAELATHLAEIISDIRLPLTTQETLLDEDETRQIDVKLAGIRVELNQLREDMDEVIHLQDFVKAAAIKERIGELETQKSELSDSLLPQTEEVRTEKTDPQTWLKCLNIMCELLEKASLSGLSGVLQMMLESLALPGIQNTHPDVRNYAVKALGLCCLLKKDTALQHLILFIQASQVDVEGVRAVALSVLFDLLQVYGLEVLQVKSVVQSVSDTSQKDTDTTEQDTSSEDTLDYTTKSVSGEEETVTETGGTQSSAASNLLTIFSATLDLESEELRTVAAEGLAKLLLSGRVRSAKLISRLILLWYNPVTADDAHLRHCLGVFFPLYAIAGRMNQEVVEEAFMMTMRTLFNASSSSPLAEVDLYNVADFLINLTSARLLAQNKGVSQDQIKDHVIHDNLALQMCNEILSHPDSFSVKVLVKALNSLDISPDDEPLLKQLATLASQMLEAVKDKMTVKGLKKFETSISELLDKHAQPGDNMINPDAGEEAKVNDGDDTTNPNGPDANGATGGGEGDTTAAIKPVTPGANTKTPTARSSRKGRPRGPSKAALPTALLGDLENEVFLSPTPLRKSSMKHQDMSRVCSESMEVGSAKLSSSSRRLSKRRVLFDVDNTSLQHPN